VLPTFPVTFCEWQHLCSRAADRIANRSQRDILWPLKVTWEKEECFYNHAVNC